MIRSTLLTWVWVAPLAGALHAAPAAAHPSPAEPPAFFSDDCIAVVDKREQESWHLSYAVIVEDTAPEVDHITLDDSKTHQFFAVAGSVFARGDEHFFVPFDDPDATPRRMPLWLTRADVSRAAAGVVPEDMTNFTAEQVAEADILENDPVLSSALRPLASGTERVPITEAQAAQGADWELAEVPAGAYQIVAYIFSPPYNGWEVRSGLVKVVDGGEVRPAVTLSSVAARLFHGQGRRVSGCVDAPLDSALHLRVREQGSDRFEAWNDSLPVSGREFEFCLPNPGVDAVMEVRVEVRSQGQLLAAMQSVDVLSMFSTAAACRQTEVVCCDSAGWTDAGLPARDAAAPRAREADAAPPAAGGGPSASGDGGGPAGDADASAPGTRADASTASSARGPAGGCQSSRGADAAPTSAAVLSLLLVLLGRWRGPPRRRA